MATLFGLLQPSSGAVTIDGTEISSMAPEALRSKLIAFPQDPFFLPNATIRQNMSLDMPASYRGIDDAILSALRAVNLTSAFGVDEPDILDTLLFPDTMLTRGQQQLFSLARAILLAPTRRVLVIDEATTG